MKKMILLGLSFSWVSIAIADNIVTTYDNNSYNKKETVVYYDNYQTNTKKFEKDFKKRLNCKKSNRMAFYFQKNKH